VTRPLALYVPDLGGGGAERAMVNLGKGFVQRGIAVDLVLVRKVGPLLAEVPSAVRVVDLAARGVVASVPALVRYIRRERPAALLSALDYANVAALWARKLSGASLPVVVVNHIQLSSAVLHSRGWRSRVLPLCLKLSYPGADAVVSVSLGAAKDLARVAGLPLASIRVIYNPVFRPEIVALAREKPSHAWLDEGGIPVVLSVGRLVPQKNYQLLLRAFAEVRKSQKARLIILGDGEEREALERMATELGIRDDTDLPGFKTNPYAFMARADVFVLSSRWEALPTVLIEAMACGAKLVATNCDSGPSEILKGGKLGFLTPVDDVGAMASAIETSLREPKHPPPTPELEKYGMEAAVDAFLALLGAIP
jgi:glycosyltransferase involved in cell wall biosynthesis